jgi:hypothetical protein
MRVAEIPTRIAKIPICIAKIAMHIAKIAGRVAESAIRAAKSAGHTAQQITGGFAMKKDYLPKSYPEFRMWLTNFMAVIQANQTAWGLPETEVTALAGAGTAYLQLDAFVESAEATSASRVARKTAFQDLCRKIRRFVNKFINTNDAVDDAARRLLGLNIRDNTRTPKPAPSTPPVFQIIQIAARILGVIYYVTEGAKKGSRPPEANGARVYYGVFDTPPASPEELPNSVFATRCPHRLTFSEGDRGKRVYIALRWENAKGQTGPWSELQSEIIP